MLPHLARRPRVNFMRTLASPLYTTGRYFTDAHRGSQDAQGKADSFLGLFLKTARRLDWHVSSYVDVGCGSGDVVRIVARELQRAAFDLELVKGYDVSPHVQSLKRDGVEFVHGDFTASDERVGLVTLFDVVEHVLDPVAFLKAAAARCQVIGLHIPLDYSINTAMRNMFRAKIENPGHLLFLDTVGALNLMAMSGLLTIDYEYTCSFEMPSGHSTRLSKIALPFRRTLFRLNPWLLSKTFGGVSLAVLAMTPEGIRTLRV